METKTKPATSENFYLAEIYIWNVQDFGIYERFSAACRVVARYLNMGANERAKKAAFDGANNLVQILNLYSVKCDNRRCVENGADIDALAGIIYANGNDWRKYV